MQLKQNKLLMYLTAMWVFLTLMLGVWWLYFIVKITSDIERISPGLLKTSQIIRMAKWEGATFFVLLVLLSITLIYLYLKDVKKNRAISSFFASITHELKTPLASMRLQSEVINETIKSDSKPNPRLETLSNRLIDDAHRLEIELDKLLQLSRMQRGASLDVVAIDLQELMQNFAKRSKLELEIENNTEKQIIANEYALSLILRNVVDNTQKHTESTKARIIIEDVDESYVRISYKDFGNSKNLDLTQLGNLFYKGKSSKGSGVGLYLIKILCESMNGKIDFINNDGLEIQLKLKAQYANQH